MVFGRRGDFQPVAFLGVIESLILEIPTILGPAEREGGNGIQPYRRTQGGKTHRNSPVGDKRRYNHGCREAKMGFSKIRLCRVRRACQ
jgi:hypothetical protein